jgi:hypothetical protein
VFADDAQLHRGRNAPAKNFPRAKFQTQKSTSCRNADGLRVSALSQFFAMARKFDTTAISGGKIFRSRPRRRGQLRDAKKFCTECVY